MKTVDFAAKLTSSKIKENINKMFGMNVSFESYSREQLEDIRNKIRTRVFQLENSTGMTDLLTNETYQKDKAMLALLNTRIKEMLGEDIAKLRDKLAKLEEAKKGVKAPRYIKHAKGSTGSVGADQDGDGKKGEFDDVQVARMTAGGVPKKKAIAKATSDKFEENRVVKGRAYGGSAQKDTDYVHTDTPSKGSSEKSAADRARDKAADRERERSGKDWEARGYKRTVVKGKSQSGSPKDDDLDEAAARLPAKKKDTTWTDKSGKKHSATKVQGHASRAADKDADKEKKDNDKITEGSAHGFNVVRYYEKTGNQLKIVNWLRKEAGLPKNAPVYFDDADLVYGDQTILPNALVNPKLKFNDLLTALAQATGGQGKQNVGGLYRESDVAEGSKHASRPGTEKRPGSADRAQSALDRKKEVKANYEKRKANSTKKAGKLEETNLIFKRHVQIVNESLAALLSEDEEGKAKAITAAGDMVNDFTSWMQRVGQFQTKTMIELADAIKADFGAAESEAFKQAVAPALQATLENLTSQREAISNAVAVLAGEAVPGAEPMGAEPEAGMDMAAEPPMEPAEPDAMNEPAPDEFAASDAAAGAGATGREMRESKFARRLSESHSIIAKLAR